MSEKAASPDRGYFFHLFNGISDAIFISSRNSDGFPGNYIEVNSVACEMLGYTREQLFSLSPLDINRVALEDVEGFHAIVDEIAGSGKALFKTDLLARDGQWIPVEINSRVCELEGKQVFFSVARDITSREKYEASIKALVRSTVGLTGQECLEEIVRNLCQWLRVECVTIGVFHDDHLQTKACYLDGTYLDTCRIPLTDAPFMALRNGEYYACHDNAADFFDDIDVLRIKSVSSFVGCPMIAHDGTVLGAVYVCSREPLQSFPYVEELLSVISSRAAAECERIHFVRELARSEDTLRTLFNSTAEAIVGIDMRGKTVFCNPSALKLLGYDNEKELVGHNFHDLIDPEPVTRMQTGGGTCPFIDAISRGEKISSVDGFFRHRRGHLIPVEYWGHSMTRDQRMVGGVITFIDISRRKTLEKQLQHSQRMEAIGTLTGGIAHDFNNILTVISGYVGLLKSQCAGDPDFLRKIEKIGEAAERGSKLTHGLLAYSRKKTEPSTPVDLNQLVEHVQELFGQMIGERISKKLTLSEGKLVVLAEPSQLEQVLVNLATNARDAMLDGGVLSMSTESIEIDRGFCEIYGYGEPGRYALITVSDTGVGIPKDLQQKIFDPFFTTKDTGKGTGLGLAMAWGIVKQHKGYILVDSTLGKGTRFKIYLPLTDRQPKPQWTGDCRTLPGGKETILLVEDDSLVRESTASILGAVGYRIICCEHAAAALEVFDRRETEIDLILSDVVMPGMKGPEFYQEIRKQSDMPIIFMSGYTFDALKERGLLKEGVILLNKPIQSLNLLTKIRELLDLRAARKAGFQPG